MQLAVWDVLCQTDVYYLIYVIICVFGHLKSEILRLDADGINDLLKSQLKNKMSQMNC